MILGIVFIGVAILVAAYFLYGRFLERRLGIDPERATPAHTQRDGMDFVPSKPAVLLGHHFSSIAGAGPIVGPIIAAAAFGWLPAVIWILVGAVLVGGVQDFSALVASVRHKACSIAQLARDQISPRARILFLIFIWFALIYVIVVFVSLTSATFAAQPGVASSSLMYIALAIVLGLLVYRAGLGLRSVSLVLVPLVFLAIWGGQQLPLDLGAGSAGTWNLILLGYCLIASVLPVWFLLQPRDYLSSFLLYACLLGGVLGILFGGAALPEDSAGLPAFKTFEEADLGYLFPAMFITIACGACSGFHTVVSSGTTAKQLASERHARPIAYGGMLLEGVLALLAIAAVILVGTRMSGQHPTAIFSTGIGEIFTALGIPARIGTAFGALAISTFLLTTLDTCTRLARYILEELFSLPRGSKASIVLATIATLALPLILVHIEYRRPDGTLVPTWKAIWPVFGATNQLLGALALLVITLWLRRRGKKRLFVAVPMVFMFSVTLLALLGLVRDANKILLVRGIAAVLLALAIVLLVEALRQVFKRAPGAGTAPG